MSQDIRYQIVLSLELNLCSKCVHSLITYSSGLSMQMIANINSIGYCQSCKASANHGGNQMRRLRPYLIGKAFESARNSDIEIIVPLESKYRQHILDVIAHIINPRAKL